MPALRKDPELVTPPQTSEAGQKALVVAPGNNPSTKRKEVPLHQPVQPSTNAPTYAHRREERLNIDEVVLKLDGGVYTGSQSTERRLYSDGQRE